MNPILVRLAELSPGWLAVWILAVCAIIVGGMGDWFRGLRGGK